MTWLAHVGGRTDLPVPLSYFIVGAGLAVVISFVVLSWSWPQPRLQGEYRRVTFGLRGPGRITAVLRLLAAVGLVLVIANGVADGAATTRAIAPVLVWVFFWLVVPFGCVIVGGLWRTMSPYRQIVESIWVNAEEKPDWLKRIGVWPSVIVFGAFVWFELVYPANTSPRSLAIAALVYGLYLFVISGLIGPQTALATGAGFETYTGIISRMAPIELRGAERPERRRFLAALPSLPIHRGTTAFIILMIGSVTYDGMSGASWWSDLVGDLRREMWFETLALVLTTLVIGGLYYVACHSARRLAGSAGSVVGIANSFAHTLVPIAFAYAFAHYFSFIVFEGQELVHNASDPFGRGWDLFGTADWRIVFTSKVWLVWYVQVAVIVLGHIGGVALAHDRALAEFGSEVAVRTQYAMLALMVALTSLGLFILAG